MGRPMTALRSGQAAMNPQPPPAGSPDPVAEWLAAARGGSAEALGQLLEWCRHYLLEVANAELDVQLRAKVGGSDLVQETFLEAQRIFARFQGTSPPELRAWLRAILVNKVATCTRHYRDTAKRQVGKEVSIAPDSDHQAELAAQAPTASSLLMREERAKALAAALARLREDYRQVIVWRQVEDLSFEEMAARSGRSLDAVRKLWWRALQQLQSELKGSP